MAAIELQTAIPDTGWVDLPLAEGLTGTIEYRVIGSWGTLRANLTGASSLSETQIPVIEGTLPPELRPLVVLRRNVPYSAERGTRRYLYITTNGVMRLEGELSAGGQLRFEESWFTN